MHYDVAVIGGGPAGLATAAALRVATKGQKSVHVFEKTGMTARGAAVLMGANGLKALHAVDPALVDGLLSKAVQLEGSDSYNIHTGEHTGFRAMGSNQAQEKYGFSDAMLGWSDITDTLGSALPDGSITTSCPVTAYKIQPDNTIQLLGKAASSSGDSTEQHVVATCSMLIGADGWFSNLRQQLLQDGPPAFNGAVAFRARIPKPDFMPENRAKWWLPPGVYPGAFSCSTDVIAIFLPLPGGDMAWQCCVPISVMQQKGLSFDPVTGEAASCQVGRSTHTASGSAKERCLRAFDEAPAMFRDVVASTPPEAITEHGLYKRTPEQISGDTWGAGMVTLAGDAAHLGGVDGTGLSMGMEDAAVLAWHVQQQGLTEAALRAYEAERIPRVKSILAVSAKMEDPAKAGMPWRQLVEERAEVLYGQASFRPLAVQSATAAV